MSPDSENAHSSLKCDRCNATIQPGEEREHLGQTLCEDCVIDTLSTVKPCDPWAVHSAKNCEKFSGRGQTLTPLQSDILKILEENGPMEPAVLLEKLDGDLEMDDLQRAFASLRHMEKARGEKQGTSVAWRIW